MPVSDLELYIHPSLPTGHPDGDGQYYHYLTKWAFALHQVAAATHDARYLQWAIELMQTAHEAFTYKVCQSFRISRVQRRAD